MAKILNVGALVTVNVLCLTLLSTFYSMPAADPVIEVEIAPPTLAPPIVTVPSSDKRDFRGARSSDAATGVFAKFHKRAVRLDEELRKLANEARKLGSSASLLSTSTRLVEGLRRILHLFHQNARGIYPEDIPANIELSTASLKKGYRAKNSKLVDDAAQPQPHVVNPDSLAEEIQAFSRDIITLFDCFRQFPEFIDESPSLSPATKLQSWAKSASVDFENEFGSLAVQAYLYGSMDDIGEQLDVLRKHYITTFTTVGIPTVRASQEHAISNLQNLTIVATLFADIATGMIQVFSANDSGAVLLGWTVLLWYMTLIFSVASAVNGLLALTWSQAIYRSPESHVPWWVLIWIRTFPRIFLVLAVACFFIALILFAFTPPLNQVTTVVTTFLSSSSCFGLIIVSGWFASELLVYTFHRGRMWLSEIHPTTLALDSWSKAIVGGKRFLINSGSKYVHAKRSEDDPVDLRFKPITGYHEGTWSIFQPKGRVTLQQRARYRWREAIRRVLDEVRLEPGRRPATDHITLRTVTGNLINLGIGSISKLSKMAISQTYDGDEQDATMVRLLQFSPDGRYLVSSRWTNKAVLFNVVGTIRRERELVHPADGGFVHQIDWSHDGRYILMRSNRKLVVWQIPLEKELIGPTPMTISPVAQHRPYIDDRTIRSASWNGKNNDGLYSVQGQRLVKMNTLCQLSDEAITETLQLRSICITSDSRWMIGIGRYIQNERVQPKYYIAVWDMNHDMTVRQAVVISATPTRLALACDDMSILVSFDGQAPSQFWQLYEAKLRLNKTYSVPKVKPYFAALPSIFGGETDGLVLRVAIVGEIYVWDRDTALLMYRVKHGSEPLPGLITSFAWNRGSKEWMIATGMHDGTVHIWTCNEHTDETQDNTVATSTHEKPDAGEQDAVSTTAAVNAIPRQSGVVSGS